MIILCSSFIETKIKEQNVQKKKNTMKTQKHTYHQLNPRLFGISSETPGSSKTSMTWTHSQCNLGLNNPFKSAMVITDLSHP